MRPFESACLNYSKTTFFSYVYIIYVKRYHFQKDTILAAI